MSKQERNEGKSGISDLTVIALVTSFLLPLVGWIVGFRARKQIVESEGKFVGRPLATAAIWIGGILWHRGDQKVIDGFLVNGSAHTVGRFAGVIRHLQSGYVYHYAFAMIAGLAVLLAWVLYAYLPFVR